MPSKYPNYIPMVVKKLMKMAGASFTSRSLDKTQKAFLFQIKPPKRIIIKCCKTQTI